MSHRRRVDAFFAALAAGQLPDALAIPDMTAWTPTSGETTRARFAGGVALLAGLFADDFAYHVDATIEEGDRVAAEVRSTGTFRDGEPYAQTHLFVLDFAGDRVARVAEHMNTIVTREQIVPRLQAAMAARG